MRNLLLKISYNGRNYHGYQIQKNAITVQEVLQQRIEKLLKHKIELKGCSRTDTGVHANEYFVSFKTENKIPCNKLVLGLNAILPADIAAKDCEEKPLSFHARYSVKSKEYIYKLLNNKYPDAINNGLIYWYKWPLDVTNLNNLAQSFVGTHNFKGFCADPNRRTDFTRTIFYFDVFKIDDIIYFRVSGNGFLYKMVRIMVGTLIEYSKKNKTRKELVQLIESRKRSLTAKPMSSEGLYLNEVVY